MTIEQAVTENGVGAPEEKAAALFDIGKAVTLANGRMWALPYKGNYAFYVSNGGKLQCVALLALEKGNPWNGRLRYLPGSDGQKIPEPADLSGTTDEIAATIVDVLKKYI